jgi:BirA family transcriptional regulator, biotin operon repressor / biotin---[acetyl-CoA-carboxylase] ligase
MNSVDSTQRWARDHVDELDDMTAVIARKQYQGRGRYSRTWLSSVGGLWGTWVCKKNINIDKLPFFALFVGYHMHKMLGEKYVNVSMKYPNDILHDSKKLVGILCNSSIRGNKHRFSLIGIGVNVNNQPPAEGISLASICSFQVTLETVLKDTTYVVTEARDRLIESNPLDIIDRLKEINCKNLPLDKFFERG